MVKMKPKTDQTRNSDVKRIWDVNAPFWDDYMGEGNHFQKVLLGPNIERMLAVVPGMHILEIACGNGNFSRRLANLGAFVTAFDFSQTFVSRAREKSLSFADQISYHVLDATNEADLKTLEIIHYNAAVCNMALMDIKDIEVLISSLPALLVPGGKFIFSITHPCFNSYGSSKIVEETDQDGEMITQYSIKNTSYALTAEFKGLGVIGQPEAQYYFHRPLSYYLNTCASAGFHLEELREPTFSGDLDPDRPFSWINFKHIPPVVLASFKLGTGA